MHKIGSVAYELKLPERSKIHPVFHVSQLKKKIGDQIVASRDPPYYTNDGRILTEPISILERRMIKKGNRAAVQWLVQWANLPPEEATWEDLAFLRSQFPGFNP